MAYIEERKNGYLVVWRDAETGKKLSRFIAQGKPGTLGEDFDARAFAEALAEEKRQTERAFRKPLERAIRHNRQDGFDPLPLFGLDDRPEYVFSTYLRTMVERDRGLRRSTRELYLRNIRLHIEGTDLGATDIRAITPDMLSDYWSRLVLGIGALRNVQQLLSKAFNRAVQTGLIDVNPLKRAPDVKRPSKRRQTEIAVLDVEEIEGLADAAKYLRDRLEILVMAYGGLRAGEVGGLRLKDIDFKQCQLNLRQQVARVTGEGQYIERLKTDAAMRTVTLPCSVTEEVRAFVEGEPPAEDGRVFHGANGGLRAHNAINHGVQLAAKRAGIKVHAHTLRHTAVSLLIREGANPKAIQQFVGYSDIRMTLGTYGHLFDYGGQALADSLEKLREAHRTGQAS
jgi:integrase